MATQRVSLLDRSGRHLLTYLPGTRDGRPWADNAALLAPAAEVAGTVMDQLKGWLVTVTPAFGAELLSHGAGLHRHAFTMARDLQPGMPQPNAPADLRFVPCDRPASTIQPAVTAAFPPGHPDHLDEEDLAPAQTELEQLLAGSLAGPLLPCSLLAVDARQTVVAGCLVNQFSPRPWITLMFRDPDRSPPGTGALLLEAVAARASQAGFTSVGLAVTAGNPAQRVYQRAGFRELDESFTVLIPD